jgi:hypothetical protein
MFAVQQYTWDYIFARQATKEASLTNNGTSD